MIFHRICIGDSIRNISKIVLLFCLAIDSKTENSILSQIHVCFSVVLFLKLRVQDHLEVTMLKKIGLIILGFNKSFISIG